MNKQLLSKLNKKSVDIRQAILEMIYKSQSSHIGSCYSCVELLIALYFCVLNINPKKPLWPNRDRFILSKGHAAAALYAVLATRGFFPKKLLQKYNANDSLLSGHPSYHPELGIELATGSLGHGLSIGAGMALRAKLDNKKYHTYVLMSDGELDEGSVWEAALFANHHKLNNLIALVDYNKQQAFGHTNEVLKLEPLAKKWHSFGWNVMEVSGHNYEEIISASKKAATSKNKPTIIIAHTIKGKGVSFMEDKILWHYHSPDAKEYKNAIKELV